MAFDDFLNHTCTIIIPSSCDEVDDWGRPINEDKEVPLIPCRFMRKRLKNVIVTDDTKGLYESTLILSADQEINDDMRIKNIKDGKGNLLASDEFRAEEILPRNDFDSLHHYKIILKGAV